jgi:protein-tyrosine-phosphatase/NAD(P)H-dependent FMN reductase
MRVLGLQGSPCKKGSTDYLLKSFLDELENHGARVDTLMVAQKNIEPCRGCGYCEKKGFCVIDDDDMAHQIYALLRQAEIVVAASPIFFYSVTAQLKALIDRTQTLWSRKYRFRLTDPLSKTRKGFLLSLGGSRGKRLFEGARLVVRYFFDAIDAEYSGDLTYPGIEKRIDIKNHSPLTADIEQAAKALLRPMLDRRKILFLSKKDACRSQMAAAFAQRAVGDRFDVLTAGVEPAAAIHPDLIEIMAEKGLDVAFRSPAPLEKVLQYQRPDIIIHMGSADERPSLPGIKTIDWDLPLPDTQSSSAIKNMRDSLEDKARLTLKEFR